MGRKPKFTVDEDVKKELLGILFGKDNFTLSVANKILSRNWSEKLFVWFENEVQKPEPQQEKFNYKQKYLELTNKIKKLNITNQVHLEQIEKEKKGV